MSDDRKWTRRAALGCLATGTGLFAAESAGYTAVSADRRSVLGTEDDDSALLKLSKTSDDKIEGDSGDEIKLIKLISQFGTSLRLDNVNIEDVSWIELEDLPNTIGTSESNSATIAAKIECDSDKKEDIQITIEASSDDQHIKLDRELTVACHRLWPNRCPVKVSGDDSQNASELSDSGGITVNKKSIKGDIETDGSIVVKNNSTVDGNLNAGGNITIKKGKIGGNVTAGRAVDIRGSQGEGKSGGPSLVCGNISAEKSVEIQNAEVSNITRGGAVFIKSNATVFGNIRSSEDNVGDVTVNGTVKGSVYSSGSVTGSGTIEGNDPRTDKNNN